MLLQLTSHSIGVRRKLQSCEFVYVHVDGVDIVFLGSTLKDDDYY